MTKQAEQGLTSQLKQWIIDSIDAEAFVQSIRRLDGGISSIMHAITLQTQHGMTDVVLRQIHDKDWLQQEPDLPLHEAECLNLASSLNVPTPQLIAYDVTGEQCGIPAVMMTKLEGAVVLSPQHMLHWLEGMASALASIHAMQIDSFPWAYFSYNKLEQFDIPAWSKFPKHWERVIEWLQKPSPAFKPCFIHRDYHPANVLWHNNRVSGIVDWVNGCLGPAGIDVGHCRVNLAMLYGVAEADAFLSSYMSEAGSAFRYDPYWDCIALLDILSGPPTVYPGWTALGFSGLSDELMIERIDQYMISLLQ